MEWGKAKTILIAVLIVVDLALAINLMNMNNSKVRLSDEYLTGSCEILGRKGLSVNVDVLSKKKNNLPTVTIPMKEMLYTAAKTVLNDLLLTETISQQQTEFANDYGNFSIFQNHEFVYIPLPKGTEVELCDFLRTVGYKKKNYTISEDGNLAQLSLNGAKLLGFTVEKVQVGGDWEVHGKLIDLDQRREDNPQFIDTVNALFFLANYLQSNDVEGEVVKQVEEVYHVTTNAAFNTVVANPIYVITTEKETYYIDAISGQILDIVL